MALLTTALAAAGMVFAGPLASFQAGGFSEAALALCTGLLRTLFPTIIFTGPAEYGLQWYYHSLLFYPL